MSRKSVVLAILASFVCSVPSLAGEIIQKDYRHFTAWIDCDYRGAAAVHYTASADTGNLSREGIEFHLDPTVPDQCQMTSAQAFPNPHAQGYGRYDRGHLVPANHMDDDRQALVDSFMVTNMWPQASKFNGTGAWKTTEEATECYREITALDIWAGVIMGDDARDDFFVGSHGIRTPDRWWKVIYRHDKGTYVAWVFPNSDSATKRKLDDYQVTLDELRSQLDYVPDFGQINEAMISPLPYSKYRSTLTCEGHAASTD